MTIYISGASGFVGQNLLRYLASKNYIVRGVNRQQLSIAGFEIPDDCDYFIHLAGKAHDLKKTLNSEEYYNINYDLTRKLYDSFLQSNAKKFVFISSVKAVADRVADVLREGDKPTPQTHYGKSKLMAEQYIQQQFLPEGKFYYIFRPCMIHGPGNKGNLNLLYNFIRKGLPYPLASFKNKRSFLSIENLCFIIEEILCRNLPSDTFNLADDEALETSEVISILASSLDQKARLWNISPTLILLFAKLGNILRLPLNTESLQKLTENYKVDNSKIMKVINKPLPLTAREGLMKTALYFKLDAVNQE